MYFLDVQVPVTHQFPAEKQHRNLMAITHFRRVVGIDVLHIDTEGSGLRQRRECVQHFLAQAAPRAGVQEEAQRLPAHGVSDEAIRRRRRI